MKAFNITSDGTVNIDFSHVTENPLINGIEIIRTDSRPRRPPAPTTSPRSAFTGTSATATDADNQGIDFGNWRGGFAVGNKVFYGYTDGYLYYRTLTGSTLRAGQQDRPVQRPVLVQRRQRRRAPTFRGMVPVALRADPERDRHVLLRRPAVLHPLRRRAPVLALVLPRQRHRRRDHDHLLEQRRLQPGRRHVRGRHHAVLRLPRRQPALGLLQPAAPSPAAPPWSAGRWSTASTGPAGRRSSSALPPNVAPTAAFTSSCTNRSCTFNASGSTDPDGSIASYAWDFGDGSNGTGVNPSHAYTADGNYTVTLTVTDNRGGTNSVSHGVSVSLPTVAFVAAADAGGGNTTAKTLTVPAAAHTGDTALLFLTKTSTATWSDPTGVTGWTQVGSYTNGTLVTTAWVKALAAGDPGATVRFTSSAASHASANVAVYSGVSTTNPVVTSAQAGDAARTTHTTPTITAAGGNWVVSFGSTAPPPPAPGPPRPA